MDLQTDSIKLLPLWIRFPDLDIKYWGIDSLSKIASTLSIPLKTDCYVKEKTWIKYARILVEIPINGPFPEYVDFFNEHDMLIRQQVCYEWLPLNCSHFGMYGHEISACRKKDITSKEW